MRQEFNLKFNKSRLRVSKVFPLRLYCTWKYPFSFSLTPFSFISILLYIKRIKWWKKNLYVNEMCLDHRIGYILYYIQDGENVTINIYLYNINVYIWTHRLGNLLKIYSLFSSIFPFSFWISIFICYHQKEENNFLKSFSIVYVHSHYLQLNENEWFRSLG